MHDIHSPPCCPVQQLCAGHGFPFLTSIRQGAPRAAATLMRSKYTLMPYTDKTWFGFFFFLAWSMCLFIVSAHFLSTYLRPFNTFCLSPCGHVACKAAPLSSSDSTLDFPKLHNLQVLAYFRPFLMLFSQSAMFTTLAILHPEQNSSRSRPPWCHTPL